MTNPEAGPPPEDLEDQVRQIVREEGHASPRLAELLRRYPQCSTWLEQTVHRYGNDPSGPDPLAAAIEPMSSDLPLQLELRLVDAVAGGGQLRKSDLAKIIEDNPKLLREIRAWIERFSNRTTTAASQFRHIHHYLLLREIGRGAMGMVFLAWDGKLDRWVALKVMRGGQLADEDVKKRFAREAKALARLRHPGIVPLFEVGECEGTPFFTTELVRGLSLDRVIRGLIDTEIAPAELTARDLANVVASAGTNTAIAWEGSYSDLVCRIGIQVAAALTASHQTGILHRDIKPSNIMLTTDGEVRVFDFGLAQVHTEQTLTRSGDLLGTPVYLATELLLGTGRVDEGSDVYGLGATLYELLALRPPYLANGIEQLYRAVRAGEPSRLRRHNRNVGRDLEEIVHKAIEKDPHQRYRSAQELSSDLATYLRREPVRIGRSRWLRHATRRVQQQGRRITLGMAVAVLAIVPVLYLLSQLTRASADSVISTLESAAMQEPDDLAACLARAASFDASDRERIEALVKQHQESRQILVEVRQAAASKSAQDLAALRRRVEGIHAGYVAEARLVLDRLDEGAQLHSKQELRDQNAELRAELLRLRAGKEALEAERVRLARSLADAEWTYSAVRGRLTEAEAMLAEAQAAESLPSWTAAGAATGNVHIGAAVPTDLIGASAWLEPSRLGEQFPAEQLLTPVFEVAKHVRNAKGTKITSEAIDAGLQWLKNHQDEDGKWDCDAFMKHDTQGEVCDGPGNGVHDVGVTGLALLAFLREGHSPRSGAYRETVRRGVLWLRDQQHPHGLFGDFSAHDFVYDHAIAAYAMCEAYGRSKFTMLRRYAQGGIDYLESHRNPYSVWRYQPRDNDNDTSVTGWCLLAYMSGKHHGLAVSDVAIQLAGTWLDQVSDPTGLHGYTKQGENDSRRGPDGKTAAGHWATVERQPPRFVLPGDHAQRFPPLKGAAMTAVGLCLRFELGQDPREKPVMRAAADLLLSRPPLWDRKAGTIDAYYWLFATWALFEMGGSHWERWQNRILDAVVKNQNRDKGRKNLYGSWDPIDVWGESGGRVGTTALLTMTLSTLGRSRRVR